MKTAIATWGMFEKFGFLGRSATDTVTVRVRSRLLAVHPRGKGSAFSEFETEVLDSGGQLRSRPEQRLVKRDLR